jgi:SAM-dependent methyltransferase
MKEGDKQSTGGYDGFRCFIINLKGGEKKVSFGQPAPQKTVAPTYSPIHPSSAGSNFDTKHGAEQQAAASHYNDLKRERSSRHLSHIFHMRNMNNVIKTEIINTAALKAKLNAINQRNEVLQGVSVIDFGCGMGGDIFKWMKNDAKLARYVGVDIAHNSLKQFTERLLTSSATKGGAEHTKVTQLVCADIGTESLTESVLPCHTWKSGTRSTISSLIPLIPADIEHASAILVPAGNTSQGSWDSRVPLTEADQFDIASCQFAMHYMFQSSAKAHHFFRQVSRHLKPGGMFIATTMDCRVVAEAVEELLYGCFDERQNGEKVGDMLRYGGISETAAASSVSGEGSVNVADPFARIREVQCQHSAPGQQKVLTYRNDVHSEVLQLKFEDDMWPRLLQLRGSAASHCTSSSTSTAAGTTTASADEESAYGIKYTFTLHDSEEDAAVDAPEWVVPLGRTLGALAAAHGLRLAEVQNFQHMASEMMANENKLRRYVYMHQCGRTIL